MPVKATKIAPPWVTFYSEIEALFGSDPAISIQIDEDEKIVSLFVEGVAKADALAQLLPSEKTFGNVSVKICVVPANVMPKRIDLFVEAFKGNPAFSYATTSSGIGFEFDYVVFRNKVVQFFNDNLGDVNGNESTLYEEIARDVFEDTGAMFCTDTEENKGKQIERKV